MLGEIKLKHRFNFYAFSFQVLKEMHFFYLYYVIWKLMSINLNFCKTQFLGTYI